MVSLLVDLGVGFIQIEITTPYFLLLWRLNYPISKTCMLVRKRCGQPWRLLHLIDNT
jgi:hypothetical protein